MPFTGTPVVKEVADNLVRITGVTIAGNDSGEIGLHENVGAEVRLPVGFQPRAYTGEGGSVSLQDAIEVSIGFLTTSLAIGVYNAPVGIEKANSTPANFIITLTNLDPGGESASPTPPLEIYIRFH